LRSILQTPSQTGMSHNGKLFEGTLRTKLLQLLPLQRLRSRVAVVLKEEVVAVARLLWLQQELPVATPCA
jgi:hypothetical protein